MKITSPSSTRAAAAFPMAAIGDPLDGWPGESWLDIRDPAVRTILAARMELAQDKAKRVPFKVKALASIRTAMRIGCPF